MVLHYLVQLDPYSCCWYTLTHTHNPSPPPPPPPVPWVCRQVWYQEKTLHWSSPRISADNLPPQITLTWGSGDNLQPITHNPPHTVRPANHSLLLLLLLCFPAICLGFTILLLLLLCFPAISLGFTILLLLLLCFPAISLGFTILLLLLFPSYISGVHHSSSSSVSQLYLWGSPFFFFFCFPAISLGSTILLLLLLCFPAISLGSTILLLLLCFPAISLGFTILLLLLCFPAICHQSYSAFHAPSLEFTILILLHSLLDLWSSPFIFFLYVPSYISGVHHYSSSAFPAIIVNNLCITLSITSVSSHTVNNLCITLSITSVSHCQ